MTLSSKRRLHIYGLLLPTLSKTAMVVLRAPLQTCSWQEPTIALDGSTVCLHIRKERNDYYSILEKTQKGDLYVTKWLEWFLNCLDRALLATNDILSNFMKKAKFGTSTLS